MSAHVLFKQLFALETADQFRESGLAERTAWEALLLGAGYGVWRLWQLRPSDALILAAQIAAGAALAHFAWFTVVLHNPLWADQWVGPLPLLTWLLPAYAVGAVLFTASAALRF